MRRYVRHKTPEERIEAAKSVADNPCVESVTDKGAIRLTDEFRDSLYFAWKFRKSSSTIDRILVEKGLGWRVTGKEEKGKALHKAFRKRFEKEKITPEEAQQSAEMGDGTGEPVGDKSKDELVEEGILKRVGRGYKLTEDFISLAEDNYPEARPTDILYEWGIYPENVGLRLLAELESRLKEQLEAKESPEMTEADTVEEASYEAAETSDVLPEKCDEHEERAEAEESIKVGKACEDTAGETDESVQEHISDIQGVSTEPLEAIRNSRFVIPIEMHPFVEKDENGNVRLTEAFYNEAKPLIGFYEIDFILAAFMLDTEPYAWIDPKTVEHDIRFWRKSEAKEESETMAALRIRGNRIAMLENASERHFEAIGKSFRTLPTRQRKEVCQWIMRLPRYPGTGFSTREITKKCGISKSVFYRYVNEEKYGLKLDERLEQDIGRQGMPWKGSAIIVMIPL